MTKHREIHRMTGETRAMKSLDLRWREGSRVDTRAPFRVVLIIEGPRRGQYEVYGRLQQIDPPDYTSNPDVDNFEFVGTLPLRQLRDNLSGLVFSLVLQDRCWMDVDVHEMHMVINGHRLDRKETEPDTVEWRADVDQGPERPPFTFFVTTADIGQTLSERYI